MTEDQHREVDGGNRDPLHRNDEHAENLPLVPAMGQNGGDHGHDLRHRLQLAQVAGLMVKPSEEAMERRPEMRNSRPMMTTAIQTLTTCGL
jgi:hypothetical protein